MANRSVGIGTNTPAEHLAIEGSGAQVLSIYSTDTGSQSSAKTFINLYGENTAAEKKLQAQIASAPGHNASSAGELHFSTNNSSSVITRRMTIREDGYVGIGTTTPIMPLQVAGNIYCNGGDSFLDTGRKLIWGNSTTWVEGNNNTSLEFGVNSAERMRIDSSGNLLVGKTSTAFGTEGFVYEAGAAVEVTTDSNRVMRLNRTTSNGNIIELNKDGTTVGSIGVIHGNNLFIGAPSHSGLQFGSSIVYPTGGSTGDTVDATVDIGASVARFKDLFLSGTPNIWTTNTGGEINFRRIDSTININNTIGTISFNGTEDSGTTILEGAKINAYSAENWTNSTAASYLTFSTTSSGSITSAEAMRIASSGNVGIGTSSPLARLSVGAGSLADGNFPVQISTPSDSGQAYFAVNRNGGYGAIFGRQDDATFKGLTIRNIVASGTSNADGISFATNNTNVRMHITGAGNVGIGTTSPGKKLEVSVGSSNTDGIRITGSSANTSLIINNTGSNGVAWDITSTGAGHGYGEGALHFGVGFGTPKMKITSTGNVGIGTNAPSAALHVSTSPEVVTRLSRSAGSNALLLISDPTTTTAPYVASYGNAMAFGRYGGGESMRIDASGRVGIGTTTPQSKLDVNLTNNQTASIGGTISAGTYAGLSFGYSEAGNSNYRHSAIVFERDDAGFGDARGNIHILNSPSGSASADLGDARLTILPSGNVGIGTTAPGYKLEVNGSFAATTKSFVIDHPTKEGMKLRYGSLEGPENGVYVRGRLKDSNVIELPDYWTGLVHEDSITVSLTAIGKSQELYVIDINDNKVTVGGNDSINCFYTIFAERKDVEKLEVEYK